MSVNKVILLGYVGRDLAEKYIRKGTRLYVEGRLRTREYEDKFKIRRRITEIHVDRVELLGRSSASQ